MPLIWVNREAKYFCAKDWTEQISLIRLDKLDFTCKSDRRPRFRIPLPPDMRIERRRLALSGDLVIRTLLQESSPFALGDRERTVANRGVDQLADLQRPGKALRADAIDGAEQEAGPGALPRRGADQHCRAVVPAASLRAVGVTIEIAAPVIYGRKSTGSQPAPASAAANPARSPVALYRPFKLARYGGNLFIQLLRLRRNVFHAPSVGPGSMDI